MARWKAYGRLPFDLIRRLYRRFRKRFFTIDKPDGEYYVVDASIEDLRFILGTRSFAPNWEWSYDKGEDLNLSRVKIEMGDEIEWWQYHVRAWERDGGLVELRCHWEPSPTEHPDAHIDGTGFSVGRGMDYVGDVLDAAHAVEIVEDPRV